MVYYWIAPYDNGNIEIISTTDDNDDKVLERLQCQNKWEWGTYDDLKILDEEQTKTFIKEHWNDFEDEDKDEEHDE